jgi:hypothetical protein
MTIETTYRAVDGTEFKNEEMCIKHEAHLSRLYHEICTETWFFDKDFNTLPFPTLEEFYNGSSYKYLDNIDIIQTKTNLFKRINEFFDIAGYCTKIINQPSAVDFYIYDDGDCNFVPIDDKAIEALKYVKKLHYFGIVPVLEKLIEDEEEDVNE